MDAIHAQWAVQRRLLRPHKNCTTAASDPELFAWPGSLADKDVLTAPAQNCTTAASGPELIA